MSAFVIHPLPAGEVDTDAPTAHRTRAEGREPCRRCLRDTEVGEALVLASYDPVLQRSPSAGASCAGDAPSMNEPVRRIGGAVAAVALPEIILVREVPRRLLFLILGATAVFCALVAVAVFLWLGASEKTARHASQRFALALV